MVYTSVLDRYRSAEIGRCWRGALTGIPVALVVNGLLILGLSNLGKEIEITTPVEMPIDILVNDVTEPILEPPPKTIVSPSLTEEELSEEVQPQANDYPAKPQQLTPKSSKPAQDLAKQPSKPIVEDVRPKQSNYIKPSENLQKQISETASDNLLPQLKDTSSPVKDEQRSTPDLPTDDTGDVPSQVNDDPEPLADESKPYSHNSAESNSSDRMTENRSQEESSRATQSDRVEKDKAQTTSSSERSEVNNSPQANMTETKPQLDQPTATTTPPALNESKVKFSCIQCDKPSFPQSARQKGIQGEVRISLDVDASGSVIAVHLLTSSGHSELDQSAIEQAKRWRFTPSENGKKGVSARINFQIEGKESAERQKELVKSPPNNEQKSELISPMESKREE